MGSRPTRTLSERKSSRNRTPGPGGDERPSPHGAPPARSAPCGGRGAEGRKGHTEHSRSSASGPGGPWRGSEDADEKTTQLEKTSLGRETSWPQTTLGQAQRREKASGVVRASEHGPPPRRGGSSEADRGKAGRPEAEGAAGAEAVGQERPREPREAGAPGVGHALGQTARRGLSRGRRLSPHAATTEQRPSGMQAGPEPEPPATHQRENARKGEGLLSRSWPAAGAESTKSRQPA